ncbi:disease resistance protein RGA4-like [Miscanthus floridulus]|uniref:disease resistance protein RGA4-like n=1 Tax=Miscanthus floridulus TaxID=154761 RepID=UPI0034580993
MRAWSTARSLPIRARPTPTLSRVNELQAELAETRETQAHLTAELEATKKQMCDDDNLIRPRRSSKLADAYDWLCSNLLVGRDSSEEKKLEELITSPDRRDKHHVISVCGNAGAGKTFIVKTMYYRCIQREMLEDLFGEYAWVDVPHPFDIMEFCRRLFFCWIGTSNMGQDFVSECSKLMHHKRRFLLVTDGLQSTNDWNSILQARQPLTACISCIVVVTRDPTVARHCATIEDEICSIRSLRVDEMRHHIRDKIIVQQLCEVVPAGTPGQEDPEMTNEEFDMLLTEEAFGIMNKCGRSPEVVGCLRSYLVSKHGDAAKIAALRHLNDNFMQELRANPDLGSLLRGYSEGIDSSSMVVYTETKLFHKLAELGIITQPAAPQSSSRTGTMRMSSSQVNSLFLEYITLCETEERIFLPLEVTVLEGGRNPSKEHVGQHLAIRKWTGEKAVFDCLDFSRLRSLTVSGEWQPFFLSDMMLVLRVLDLEGTTSNLRDGDLKQIVEQLPRLKFLSLRGCKEITRLPRSMGGLRQLQALDVRGTCVVRLPGSIVKLHKLQYLRAGDGQGGVRFSGLKFLKSSLKQILLKGPGCNAVGVSVREQLNLQIPNNQIALTIAQGHGSQPEPGPAQGNQEMPASSLAEQRYC